MADPRISRTPCWRSCESPRWRPAPSRLATSGTIVHRWTHDSGVAHHLIDPRTRRPAVTDVVQATVLAETARDAEAFAKVAVVAGSVDAFGASTGPACWACYCSPIAARSARRRR